MKPTTKTTSKIEIISIDLGLDLKEEIKKHSDDLSDLTRQTEAIAARIAARNIKPLSKKDQEAREWDTKLTAIHKVLKIASSTKTPYLTMATIAGAAGITIDESESIKFPAKFKAFLEKLGDNSELLKKKVQGKTCYAVARFGGQDSAPPSA